MGMHASDCENKDAKTCVTMREAPAHGTGGCAWKGGKCFYNPYEHDPNHHKDDEDDDDEGRTMVREAMESSPVLAPAGVLAAAAIGGIVVAAVAIRRRNENEPTAEPAPYGTL